MLGQKDRLYDVTVKDVSPGELMSIPLPDRSLVCANVTLESPKGRRYEVTHVRSIQTDFTFFFQVRIKT